MRGRIFGPRTQETALAEGPVSSSSADPSLRGSVTSAFLAGRPELPGFARSQLSGDASATRSETGIAGRRVAGSVRAAAGSKGRLTARAGTRRRRQLVGLLVVVGLLGGGTRTALDDRLAQLVLDLALERR